LVGFAHSLRVVLETRGVAAVLAAAAAALYAGWIIVKIDLAATNDFYVYYIAAAAFAAGDNAYALDPEQFVVLLIPLFVLLELSLSESSKHWMLAPLIAVGAMCSASNVRAFGLTDLVDAHLALCLLTWGLAVDSLRTEPAILEQASSDRR